MNAKAKIWLELGAAGAVIVALFFLLHKNAAAVAGAASPTTPPALNNPVIPPLSPTSAGGFTLNPVYASPTSCGCGCDGNDGLSSTYNGITQAYAQAMSGIEAAFYNGVMALVPESVSQYYNQDNAYQLFASTSSLFGADATPGNSAIDVQSIYGGNAAPPQSVVQNVLAPAGFQID